MLRTLLKSPPAPPERTIMMVEGGARRLPVILRVSDRATRIALRLGQKADAFILTLPRHAREKDALRFAERHIGWMQNRLSRLPRQVPFAPGEVIPLRGQPHRLVPAGGLRGLAHIDNDTLLVPGLPDHFARKVTDFLKRQARQRLEPAVAHYSAAIDVKPRRLTLRDPATRWGSCSSNGTLSFSWRLIMAPDYVLDYLAAHEVTHLRHMNHSRAYWRLLREICPHTDSAETWLKRHGRTLHTYGDA